MNKKLTNILRTNVTLYFICLVLFALAAIPFDVRLAIGEGAAAVVLLIIARRRSRSVQQSMRQYMDRFTGGMDSARSSNMLFAPLPMMVFDMDTQAVVWCNDGFLALTEQKEGVFDAHLNAVVPTFSVRWLMEGKNECPEHVVWNHRIYRVYGGLTRPTPDTPATMATTYWMDVTDSEQLRQTLQMTRPVVAILMVDNYEDLMKACPESKRSAVLAQLEEKLDQWSAGADGLMLHYDRDRYLFVFEERSYSDYAQHRFAVLDTVREVAAGGVAATLSIGVGRDADSFDALFKNASLALEMALSRGGDQAVVKDRLNFQFYGGRAKSTEKRTKVKSRVMANALGELMDDARQVYVMGHSYADMDSLGAAAGVCCIARKRGKKCQIVIDTENNAAHPILRKLVEQPEYHGAFLTGSEAFLKVQPGTLLVVVDTNRPGSVESEQLLETCNRVAVIDHHRRGSSYIEKMALNYHEPYASSASELVTELLQYLVEPGDILKCEAEALLAAVYPIAQALKLAEEHEADLVEISPNAVPPVCRIIDYSKFLYQLKKRAKEQKAKQVKVNVKEIRFGPQTDEHDYNFKLKHAIGFLQDGDKVKAYVFFKGRSILFKEQGEVLLLRFANDLEDYAKVEQMPLLEGKRMTISLSPKKPGAPKKAAKLEPAKVVETKE